ncbi:glycosyltransferase [Pararoseomonas sp. SCSIO 73927]|uniref:glycosyltransferase family 32 protein n=1 Tax=Pararoseomonas sp. SCSIO 73927 TaxID=3114537 RepID=UPI0030D35149
MNLAPDRSLTDFPRGFHEVDALRSEFVRRLFVAECAEGNPSANAAGIPKVLVRFWDDAAAVPPDVQACLDSWNPLREDGFEVLTFDDASAAAHIRETCGPRHLEAFARCHHPAMRSDLFRLCYLLSSGGFYVDADDAMTEGDWPLLYGNDRLKLQPLSFDIPSQSMVEVAGFWRFDRPRPDRLYYVNNNPLVAPAGHPVLRRALERATDALLGATGPVEIQATTGPGNLTVALVEHAHERALAGLPPDYEMIRDWDRVGWTRWELSYREDGRNWRNIGAGRE